MRRIFIIAVMALFIFFIQLVLFNLFGRWFQPNLLIVFIVFINLYLGIRYSIVAAIFSGIIQDCFSVSVFGISIFSFVMCAYLTTFIRRYFYEAGSASSRLKTIFLACLVNILLTYMISVMFGSVDFGEMFSSILAPEVVTTLIAAPYFFKKLNRYAIKITL